MFNTINAGAKMLATAVYTLNLSSNFNPGFAPIRSKAFFQGALCKSTKKKSILFEINT